MCEGFCVDFFCKREAISASLGKANKLFKPGSTGGLEMDAGVKFLHGRVNSRVDGKFVAAGVHTLSLRFAGNEELTHGPGNSSGVEVEFASEGGDIADVVNAFVEAATEFWRNGLDRNGFVRNGGEDDEKLPPEFAGRRSRP